MTEPLLRATGLSKVFDGVEVLSDADLEVRSGRIHALVGANGSGKSTLIKILSGYHAATRGQVESPSGGQGPIAFVHQDLGLVESLSVLENVALTCGFDTGFGGRVQWRRTRERVRALLQEFAVEVDPDGVIGDLGGTERRLVAIARAVHSLGGRRGVLVLDEPTAALPPDEVHLVFALMRTIAERGSGVLFVCHDLVQTLDVADELTVLRNGRVVRHCPVGEATPTSVAQDMFGAPTRADGTRTRRRVGHDSGLTVAGLTGKRVQGLDLAVARGEIVGITGLIGCGKSELGRLVAGVQPSVAGTVAVHDGQPFTLRSTHQALQAGIAYVPPDRRRSGGVLPMRAYENVTLSTLDSVTRAGRVHRRTEIREVTTQMRELGVVPLRPLQAFAAFSGGNQQKLVLARVLRIRPKVVVLDDPTQGVDAETIPELYRFVRELADGGCSVLMITSDLDELVQVSDRVVVLRDGHPVHDLEGDDVNVTGIGTAVAAGGRPAVTA